MKVEFSKTERKVWTILSLIDWSSNHLTEKGFDEARLHVELLLCHILSCKRIDLYLRFDQILNNSELEKFKLLLKRRLKHEPLQYIIGETEFMGLSFQVDPRVFIPRPETEILVEQIIKWSMKNMSDKIQILDVGTGSGNIAISLAVHLDHSIIDAIDISSAALEVAKVNVQNHHVDDRVFLAAGDILHGFKEYPHFPYDVIVSNPPYISKKEFQELQPEVRDYEPALANTDDADGLTFYKNIATNGKKLLRAGGAIFVEMAYNQNNTVPNIFEANGYSNVEVIPDYSGIKRVVKALVC